jgi:hypothetical protein
MTFRQWLRQQRQVDTPIGDFARDALRARGIARHTASLDDLLGYLYNRGACEGAIDAAIAAWMAWPDHPEPRTIQAPKRRFEVMRRDDFACQLCGATAAEGAKLEVDHRIPRARGGLDIFDNLWTLCATCNRGKSDTLLPELCP